MEQKADVPNEMISKNNGGDINDQGTWIHEKLILSLARYISVEFEIWNKNKIIIYYITYRGNRYPYFLLSNYIKVGEILWEI